MAVSVKFFARRRIANALLLLAAGIVCVVLWRALDAALRPHALHSGIALLLLLLLLTAFNARKKLPFLPLIRASHWLQFHIYAGFLSVLLFGLHTDFRLPAGTLEIVLSILFGIVTLSGLIGLYLTRSLPPVMARSGEPLTYESIPKFEIRLRRKVEEIVEEAEKGSGASAVGDLYLHHLSTYFKPRSTWASLLGKPKKMLSRALESIDKVESYTGQDEHEALEQIRKCVRQKHNLDVQNGAQILLRSWLFIHIPFTYSLLITSFAHAWIVLVYIPTR
jgi:hypothetical protein